MLKLAGNAWFCVLLALSLSAGSSASCPSYDIEVFTDTSKNAWGLQGIVDKFSAALGGDNNRADPAARDGFRTIVWDADQIPFDMPADFFEKDVPLGAVFETRHDEFRVSNPPDGYDDKFDSIVGKKLASRFQTFSPPRLFTPLKSNKMLTHFTVPGKPGKTALTSGFGVVFTDVEYSGSTSLQIMDICGCFIGRVTVPKRPKGLSFAGITAWKKGSYHPEPVIAEAKLTLGSLALGSRGWGDLVVMDDFIYGEPQPAKKCGDNGDHHWSNDGGHHWGNSGGSYRAYT